jgi:hypothetical protein
MYYCMDNNTQHYHNDFEFFEIAVQTKHKFDIMIAIISLHSIVQYCTSMYMNEYA